MENSYGIGTKNRFAMFIDDEQDPLEAAKDQAQTVDKKKPEKGAEKENKSKLNAKNKNANIKKINTKDSQPSVPTTKSTDNAPARRDDNRNRQNPGKGNLTDRPVRFGSGPRQNESNTDSKDMENQKNKKNREGGDFRDGEGRRGGRGGSTMGMRGNGRGRGGRGRGGFDFRGKREFDRQSGSDRSGVKAVDKRDGAGSHNWGTVKDDIHEQFTTGNTTEETSSWGEKPTEKPTEVPTEIKEGEVVESTEEDKEPVEDEPKEMTLDEYKQQQQAARLVPKYNIRKAGEGEDNAQWKKTFVLEKKKVEESDEDDEEEEDEDEVVRRGRSKQTVEIDIQFSDSRHGRGGRGGRGGSGGGRGRAGFMNGNADRPYRGRGGAFRGSGRGGPSGPRSGQNAPNMLDENDFPSLASV